MGWGSNPHAKIEYLLEQIITKLNDINTKMDRLATIEVQQELPEKPNEVD